MIIMLLPPTSYPKPIQNKANSVHISNLKRLENYNAKKLAFKEADKVNGEKIDGTVPAEKNWDDTKMALAASMHEKI